jgi:hypothetical protein
MFDSVPGGYFLIFWGLGQDRAIKKSYRRMRDHMGAIR